MPLPIKRALISVSDKTGLENLGRALAEQYGITALPTMMVVDGEGKILAVGHSVQALTAAIDNALKSIEK